MAPSPNPQLDRQWQQRLDRFADSDLTIAQFCRLEGTSQASFYQWRRRLADRATPAFLPVDLPAQDHQHQASQNQSGTPIEVELPGGARVKISAGVQLPEYRNLMAAIVQATAGDDAHGQEADS